MSTFSVTGVGARAGMAMKAPKGFMKALSQESEPGGKYRLFIPTIVTQTEDGPVNDFLVGFGAGRDLSFDVFGTTFMTYKKEWFEDDGSGPKCKIGCDQFAKVSRAILEAQCASEKDAARAEADVIAASNGGQRNEVALIRKLDRIDEKYHGREAEDGAQKTYASVNPMVSGLKYLLIMEMLMVPMDSTTNTPKWDSAKPVYKKCSNTFLQKLFDIMDDSQFFDSSKGYLEVAYTYGSAGQEKKIAGQSQTFQGIVPSLGLEATFPDLWKKFGENKIAEIAGGKRDITQANELILRRTGYTPGNISPEDIKSKMFKWVASNTVILTHIDPQEEATKKAAKDMINLGILDSIIDVKNKVKAIADSQEDEGNANAGSVEQAVNDMAPTTPTEQNVAPQMSEQAQNMTNSGNWNPVTEQAQNMINSGEDLTGRVAQNLQLPEEEEDDLGDMLG